VSFIVNGKFSSIALRNMQNCYQIRILIDIILMSLLIGCSGKCRYKIFQETPNPGKNLRVVKFFNWCGYTSSNNINLSILRNSDSVENRDKIVFVAASGVGDQLDKDTTVKFSWLNDSVLLISHNKNLQIFEKKLILDGIQIHYTIK